MRRLACLLAALTACAPPATNVTVRELALPGSFDRATGGPSAGTIDWRTFFGDPQLAALVGEALEANTDVQIAVQRIELARFGVRRATGARLPEVSLAAGAAVRRFGLYTMDGAGNATTDITPGRIVPNPLGDLGVRVQASWEVDLWGRLRGLRGAARAQYLASIEGAHLVVTNLVADIAIAYIELVALDEVREILVETLARQAEALDVMRAQKEAGRTNELAVQQFDAQLAETRALDAATTQQIVELEMQLNVLLGRLPRPIARSKALLDREVPSTLDAGVPSELLRNRPDIREAELQVQAAKLDVAATRAAFFPQLQLSAEIGLQAFEPRYLVRPDSIAGALVGGLVAPLLNRRGLEADHASARATQLQALHAYRGAVVRSFAEVTAGLSALAQSSEIVAARTRRQAATASTVETADALFRAGKATYLEVLVAQQQTLEARLDLVEALRDRHIARIRLYRALGGGWRGALNVQR